MNLFEGVRVLDLSRMLAGPFGSMLLADMGAEVIKIRPGILERLGCARAVLHAANPRLVICSISAYGHDGPYRDWPAFDLALQAMGGAMSLTGEPGGSPVRMGLPLGDLAGGMFGAFAVAGALVRRARTGEGACVDLSLTNRDRVAHRLQLTALMEEVFPVRTTEEWLKRLQDEDVPVAPILGVDRVPTDPQVRHRQMVTEVIRPELGPVPTLGTPIKVDEVLGLAPAAPPRQGEHTDAILTGLLGYPADRVAALRSAGVVA